MTPDQARAILDARARALARPHAVAADAAQFDAMIFELGGERFAIETRHVLEVVRLIDVTPLPGVPEFVVGVTNYRGNIVCVVDVRPLVGAPRGGLSDLSRLLILGGGAAEFAILADRVEGAPSLRIENVLPAPESLAPEGHELVIGVTREAVVVLDGAKLLDDPRLVIDDRGAGTV